jgi:hypothetical protein
MSRKDKRAIQGLAHQVAQNTADIAELKGTTKKPAPKKAPAVKGKK